jgi:acetyltransferase-like isoleucine patch superfamily enzyme
VLARIRSLLAELPRQIGYVIGPRVMSALRKRWVLLRHPHANIVFKGPVHIGPGFSLHIPGPGTFIVGPHVAFRRDFRAEVDGDGRIEIGARSGFTYGVVLQCSTSIEIGEGCMFAQSAMIVDGSHRFRDLDRPVLEQGYDFRPIRIGDEVWVSAKCTVMADVGERSTIGANSVVSRPVPAYCVAVGAPARVIDYFGPKGLEPEELAHSSSDGG